ncbi:MAG: hypothetical protein M3Y09_01980 [Actinomycetota bacterium]|nr:hypothetical protein [Actinomycetota bacterium]
MIRQRIGLRTPGLAYVVRALTVLLALALMWYGLMVVLLAVKVSPHTVNSLSAYHTLYDDVVGLKESDFSTAVRFIAGAAGLVALMVFVYLAAQELPRPYLARGDVILQAHERGKTVVKPRAIERMAELAAHGNANVSTASSRLGDQELNVDVSVRRASLAAGTLTDVRTRVLTDLDRHQFADLPVNVTLTGYDRKTKRELS